MTISLSLAGAAIQRQDRFSGWVCLAADSKAPFKYVCESRCSQTHPQHGCYQTNEQYARLFAKAPPYHHTIIVPPAQHCRTHTIATSVTPLLTRTRKAVRSKPRACVHLPQPTFAAAAWECTSDISCQLNGVNDYVSMEPVNTTPNSGVEGNQLLNLHHWCVEGCVNVIFLSFLLRDPLLSSP